MIDAAWQIVEVLHSEALADLCAYLKEQPRA
jgi:hypothetical protein